MNRHSVDSLVADILRREGGYVDDPDDKGGATNYGISLRYARGVGLDLNGDGVVDGEDICLVTPEIAAELYKQDFYHKPRIDRLPDLVQPIMFDWAVNSGPPRAIGGLQEVLTLAGWKCDIDGVIGPQTIRACQEAATQMGPLLVNALSEYREEFYRRIVERDPSQGRFLKGWIRRAREFRMEVV